MPRIFLWRGARSTHRVGTPAHNEQRDVDARRVLARAVHGLVSGSTPNKGGEKGGFEHPGKVAAGR